MNTFLSIADQMEIGKHVLKQHLTRADNALNQHTRDPINARCELATIALEAYFKKRDLYPEPFEGADELANMLLDKATK